jgi:complement component 1 Q subcomponent-binding protein
MFSKVIRPVAQLARASCWQNAYKAALPKTLTSSSMPVYSFSTQLEKTEKAHQKLFKAIEKEHKFEKDNYQSDESIAEFLKEKKFELIDKESESRMELYKKQGDIAVTIAFNARSPPQQQDEAAPEENQAQPPGAQGAEEEQQDYQDYCDFTVYVEGKNGALVFECSSFDAELSVHSVNPIKDVKTHKAQSRVQRISDDYQGPDFSTLDERLQTSLVEYLKSVGVDEETTSFVEHVSLDKEQRLYMNWLAEVKKALQ